MRALSPTPEPDGASAVLTLALLGGNGGWVGRVVIACYVPRPGREEDLYALARTHVPRLRAEGLVTDREPILAVAADGSVVEVFEWVDADAIAAAHTNAVVLSLWREFDEVCTYRPVGELAEAASLFVELAPLPPAP